MKLPSEVSVFGSNIPVMEVPGPVDPKDGTPVDGMYCYSTKSIIIDKSLSSEEKVQTLLHEMGHAMFHRMSICYTNFDPNLEEMLVNSFGTMVEEAFHLRIKRKKG